MIFEALMTGILAYQVMMPAVNNGRYQIVHDGKSLVRMNTQDGTMERCDEHLRCQPIKRTQESKDDNR